MKIETSLDEKGIEKYLDNFCLVSKMDGTDFARWLHYVAFEIQIAAKKYPSEYREQQFLHEWLSEIQYR